MNTRGSSPTLVEEVLPWLASLKARGLSPKTMTTYLAGVRSLSDYLGGRGVTAYRQVEAAHLRAWQATLRRRCAPATVDVFVRAVRLWFAWLTETGTLFSSPAAGTHGGTVPRKLGLCPEEAEVELLLESVRGADAISIRDRALLEIAYATGARLAELSGLAVNCVDLAGKHVLLHGKGGRDRVVPLTSDAVAATTIYLSRARPELLRRQTDHGWLFVSLRRGQPLSSQAIEVMMKSRAARAELKISAHALRRAFATHLLKAGAHPEHVREMLGHRGYRHLWKYVQLDPAFLRKHVALTNPQQR